MPNLTFYLLSPVYRKAQYWGHFSSLYTSMTLLLLFPKGAKLICLQMTLLFTESTRVRLIRLCYKRTFAIAFSLHVKQLSLNEDKCCYLFISRKRSQSIQPPSLTVDSNPLKQVQSYKYLGVLITVDLTWSAHLQVISTKTRKLLGMIYRRFYSNSTSSTMFKLYKSFIRPII